MLECNLPSPLRPHFEAVVMHVSFSSEIPTPDTLLDKATTFDREVTKKLISPCPKL